MATAKDVIINDLQYIVDQGIDSFEKMANKSLLVTGGAGFIGYYLVQSILHWNQINPAKTIKLTIYDNLMRGVPDWLAQLDAQGGLQLVKHDISNPLPEDMEAFDFILHGATIASPLYYRKFPIETMDANVRGVRSLLEKCRVQKEEGHPVEGFLFFSSSEIYGDPLAEHIPTPETYWGNVSCTGPRACYDESKRYGETLCINFAQQYKLPIKIVRPFNNYGPGLKITDKRVLPDFARNMFDNHDMVMYSDGSATRTFCYIADAVVGYFKVLVHGTPGEAYNIGAGSPEISVYELAQMVAKIGRDSYSYSGEIVRKINQDAMYLTDSPNRRCPDISKAQKDLQYQPGISLADGLQRTLIWYLENRNVEEE
ncbi:MAG: NAD-dependent epimerase/dehydratase family protein [Magnetococcales bacterium]|nr:NAD-dependent epimerase/dehydratase family protein [Magnetococcales bacterium]